VLYTIQTNLVSDFSLVKLVLTASSARTHRLNLARVHAL
jgi:hypothetical protein